MTLRRSASWKDSNITLIWVPFPYQTKAKSIRQFTKWSQMPHIVSVEILLIPSKRNSICGKFPSDNLLMLILMMILRQESKKCKKSRLNGSKEPKRKNGVNKKTKPCSKISKINLKSKLPNKSSPNFKDSKTKPNTPKFKKLSKTINLTPKIISSSFKEWKRLTNTLWKVKKFSSSLI